LIALVIIGVSWAAEPQVNITTNLTSRPLAFTENQGQWDDQVKFRADANGATMWFTPGGACYQFTRRIKVISDGDPLSRGSEPDKVETMMIGVSFVGAYPYPRVVGENLTGYKCNYFIGDDKSKWRTDVPNYRAVVYEDIYPGIDLKYYGNGNQMEYDFIVPPFADYSRIKIRYDGSLSMSVSPAGELAVRTKWGTVVEQRPVVYQVVNNLRVPVEGEYVLKGDNCFGFEITGEYDRSLPLVIDPVLTYSTYLGGSSYENLRGVAVDGSGCAYVTGYTASTNFPIQYPYQTDQGSYDIFVTKLNSSGDGLIYSTYLGGSSNESGWDIAVDAMGCAYVTGGTSSVDFPTVNAYQTDQGGDDGFVTKLNGSGSGLLFSTYLGGSFGEVCRSIAVDVTGLAYVTGATGSSDFPTQSPYQTDQGGVDVFVTKLTYWGTGLSYSTYLGGSGTEFAYGIDVDPSGFAYITGYTGSTDFPTLNPYQGDQGNDDVFVTKLSSTGSALVYSTYLGGSGTDIAWDIAIDGSGCAYVAGVTASSNFPTENPFQTDQTYSDAFVSKLNSSGDGLVYSTYLGGDNDDRVYAIAVDDFGCAYVTGSTMSTDFPVQNPCMTDQDTVDVFVTKLTGSGDSLVYSTYLGGEDHDEGWGIAIDGATGVAYIGGTTNSSYFPTVNPYQDSLILWGWIDGFVARLTTDIADLCVGDAYPVGVYPLAIVAADFDGDDDNDLAVANYESDSISILLNFGDGTLDTAVSYAVGDGPRGICAGDFDNDGDVDLAVANEFDDNISVLKNYGDGVFDSLANYAAGTSPVAINAGYLDTDAYLDLAVANYDVDSMYVLFNDGDGSFDGSTDGVVGYGTGNGPRSVFTADLDSDGDQDVAVANELDDDVSIYTNNGNGGLTRGSDVPVGDGPVSITGSDLDDDSDQDLVTANYESNNVSVIENELVDGFGGLVDGVVGYGTGNGPRSVFTADLDGDGDDDLVVANEESDDVSVLHNNGDGTFADALPFASHDGPAGVVATDLDGDYDNDVAVANCESDDVVILVNQTDVGICCELRGDFDHNGAFSPLDAVAMVAYLWTGGEADVNDSGGVDPMDAVYMVYYFWLGGPAPVECPE